MAPPGRPNTTSTPWRSRLRTSAWAPVTCTGVLLRLWALRGACSLNKKPPGRTGRGGVARARQGFALRDEDYSELVDHDHCGIRAFAVTLRCGGTMIVLTVGGDAACRLPQ